MDPTISSFLQHLIVEKGFSRNTSDAYRNDLQQFWDFLQGNRNGHSNFKFTWSQVDIETLNRYIEDLRVRKGYRDATTARKVASIKSFFGFLSETGAITEDPTESLGSPRVGRTLPKFLSEIEVTGLLDAAYRSGSTEGQRDAVIMELLYATGLRVGELVSLNMQDVNTEESYIRCLGKGSKERIVYLYPKALAELKRYSKGPRMTMFGAPEVGAGPVREPQGRAADPAMGLDHPQDLRPKGQHQAEHHAPHPTPQASPPTCCRTGLPSGTFRNCWGTPASPLHRSIPI